jgi:hypothetical protein
LQFALCENRVSIQDTVEVKKYAKPPFHPKARFFEAAPHVKIVHEIARKVKLLGSRAPHPL